jgi:osmotically-inducible protein OsmY
MNDKANADAIRAALERELGDACKPCEVSVDGDGLIRLRGAVDDIRTKRRALHVAIEAAGTRSVKNDLTLVSVDPQPDDRIADLLDMALRSDSVFQGIPLQHDRQPQPDRHGDWICLHVENGVVRLSGEVPSLSHRRFAEVLAWWTPGVVNVDNRLHVHPPEEENDGEISDLVHMVFEKDTTIDAELLQVRSRNAVVTIYGPAASAEQAARAERNCWYVPGVHDVRNQLEIPDPGR